MNIPNPPTLPRDAVPMRGYIEGYYGRWLRWDEREAILKHLHHLEMNTYLYAPKEDPCHRFDWRREYDHTWQENFNQFCRTADALSVMVIAGIAPGADYNFKHIGHGDDWQYLRNKCRMMVDQGATAIALLLDDIQPDLPNGDGFHEGEAHAALANALHNDLAQDSIPLLLTPRIYADEVMDHDIMAGGNDDARYWPDLAGALNEDILLLICGSHVIAHDTRLDDTAMIAAGIDAGRAVIWDNLYAHDYCPRRLFLGPYQGRDAGQSLLLNPTGMVKTDTLLLSIMAGCLAEKNTHKAWTAALASHDVPEAFHTIAAYLDLPPYPDQDGDIALPDNPDAVIEALDILLWQWKSDLAREWYPFLMGLKQDIMLSRGQMTPSRIRKSLPPLLSPLLRQNLKETKRT